MVLVGELFLCDFCFAGFSLNEYFKGFGEAVGGSSRTSSWLGNGSDLVVSLISCFTSTIGSLFASSSLDTAAEVISETDCVIFFLFFLRKFNISPKIKFFKFLLISPGNGAGILNYR